MGPDPNSRLVSGSQAKAHLERSRLPTSVLHRIWNLADVSKDGYLDLYEYSLAMHFVSMKLSGLELPPFLPACLAFVAQSNQIESEAPAGETFPLRFSPQNQSIGTEDGEQLEGHTSYEKATPDSPAQFELSWDHYAKRTSKDVCVGKASKKTDRGRSITSISSREAVSPKQRDNNCHNLSDFAKKQSIKNTATEPDSISGSTAIVG